MITQDKILELRELLAKGTQGEWTFFANHIHGSNPYVADTLSHNKNADAALIAALHNAAPDLLDAVEEAVRLREENRVMRGSLERVKRASVTGETVHTIAVNTLVSKEVAS